jgi:hypothetical protein
MKELKTATRSQVKHLLDELNDTDIKIRILNAIKINIKNKETKYELSLARRKQLERDSIRPTFKIIKNIWSNLSDDKTPSNR